MITFYEVKTATKSTFFASGERARRYAREYADGVYWRHFYDGRIEDWLLDTVNRHEAAATHSAPLNANDGLQRVTIWHGGETFTLFDFVARNKANAAGRPTYTRHDFAYVDPSEFAVDFANGEAHSVDTTYDVYKADDHEERV